MQAPSLAQATAEVCEPIGWASAAQATRAADANAKTRNEANERRMMESS
jgi:hypothetical protein